MDLPVEVIQRIFHFLSPCEIMQLRQVSKHFRDITHNDVLWRELYADTRSLLPPGPFPWQSTQYLERALVRSELVSKTWISQAPGVLASTHTRWKPNGSLAGRRINWAVVFGRWCMFLEGKIIQCHDIDIDTYRSLYDGTHHSQFAFIAHPTVNTKGQWVYLFLANCGSPLVFLRLLEFHVADNVFSGPEILDWIHIEQQLQVEWSFPMGNYPYHGSTPFLSLQMYEPPFVLDLRTRGLYTLPVFCDALMHEYSNTQLFNEFANEQTAKIIPTSTHVIVFRSLDSLLDVPTFIQAFVTPDSSTVRDRDGIGELRLTHQAAVSINLLPTTLVRNSIIDPVTGSVNIRLLESVGATHLLCHDLTLPKPCTTTDVLPLHIHTQLLFESSWRELQYAASDDGHVRGLLLSSGEHSYPHRTPDVRKFSIDASGEEIIVTFSDLSPLDCPSAGLVFDGIRGRVHWLEGGEPAGADREIITVDLA